MLLCVWAVELWNMFCWSTQEAIYKWPNRERSNPYVEVCNWRRWEAGSQHPSILRDILISALPPLLHFRQHACTAGTQRLAHAMLAVSSITAQLFAFRCVFPNIQL